ncbi:hypothetical protein ACA910_017103 [Epithemia clementina (nom. ined.)]
MVASIVRLSGLSASPTTTPSLTFQKSLVSQAAKAFARTELAFSYFQTYSYRSTKLPKGCHRYVSTTSSLEHENPSLRPSRATPNSTANKPERNNKSSFIIYYNDVYEVQLPPNHRFPMSKYRQTRELVQTWIANDRIAPHREQQQIEEKLLKGIDCEFRVSPLATVEELETTHCPSYIQRYMTGDMTETELRNVGFPWSKESVQRSLSSVGGTLAAACEAVERHINNNHELAPLSLHWAAHIAGGTHHAFYDRGEGFSVFSDMAVAANVVLKRYPDHIKRILFVDLDVHQGNGNAVLFRNKPEVFTFSLHCKSNYFSQKETSDLDIELPAECGDTTYLMTLQHWLNRFRRGDGGKFDIILFQAGVDVLDVDRLGRMALTQSGVERRNQLVFEFGRDMQLPLVICMGGGYPRRGSDWAPVLNAHANVYYRAFKFLEQLHTQNY